MSDAHRRLMDEIEARHGEEVYTLIGDQLDAAGVRRDLYELTVDYAASNITLKREVDGLTVKLVDESDEELSDYWAATDPETGMTRHAEGSLDMLAEWASVWVTAGKAFAGVTLYQSDDQEPLTGVFPLHDVDALTDAEAGALLARTREAMRPLVEAAWRERGATVRWRSEPRTGQLGILRHPGTGDLREDVARDLAEKLCDAEVAVWGEAYAELDSDALWAVAVWED